MPPIPQSHMPVPPPHKIQSGLKGHNNGRYYSTPLEGYQKYSLDASEKRLLPPPARLNGQLATLLLPKPLPIKPPRKGCAGGGWLPSSRKALKNPTDSSNSRFGSKTISSEGTSMLETKSDSKSGAVIMTNKKNNDIDIDDDNDDEGHEKNNNNNNNTADDDDSYIDDYEDYGDDSYTAMDHGSRGNSTRVVQRAKETQFCVMADTTRRLERFPVPRGRRKKPPRATRDERAATSASLKANTCSSLSTAYETGGHTDFFLCRGGGGGNVVSANTASADSSADSDTLEGPCDLRGRGRMGVDAAPAITKVPLRRGRPTKKHRANAKHTPPSPVALAVAGSPTALTGKRKCVKTNSAPLSNPMCASLPFSRAVCASSLSSSASSCASPFPSLLLRQSAQQDNQSAGGNGPSSHFGQEATMNGRTQNSSPANLHENLAINYASQSVHSSAEPQTARAATTEYEPYIDGGQDAQQEQHRQQQEINGRATMDERYKVTRDTLRVLRTQRRRTTHNEVERRRREIMNQRFDEVAAVLPDNFVPDPEKLGNRGVKISRLQTLESAAVYIRYSKSEVQSLQLKVEQLEMQLHQCGVQMPHLSSVLHHPL